MKMLSIAAVTAAALALAACSKDEPTAAAASAAPAAPGPSSVPSGPSASSVAYFNQVVGDRVFFATDRHSLDVQARTTLDRQAQWLLANPSANLTIEGHADERGTRQYNLALGARRANSVRSYLASRGIAGNRMRTVTFGKERPVALCSDDSCWSQNRRGVSIVAGAPSS